MSEEHVRAIKSMYRAAIDQVDAGAAVRRNLSLRESQMLDVAGVEAPISEHGVYVISLGKAALGMCSAAAAVLEDRLAAGIVVTKDEQADAPDRVRIFRGSHPVPNERSVEAGNEVLDFAASIPVGALVLCLISGGGSSLVEVPRSGVSLDDLRDITSSLLRRGASIREINAVRSRLSAIKAGGLLRSLAHASVHNLIVSDVLGDDLHSIASGPTIPSAVSIDPASVLADYEIVASLPPGPRSDRSDIPPTAVVANVSIAVDAVATRAASLGYAPFVLTRSVAAEAREVGSVIAGILRDAERDRASIVAGTCLIAGGETVVTLRGHGTGGRNTEAALSAAIELMGSRSSTVGFLATDGDDGISGAAGAIVDGRTIPMTEERRARSALRDNDSYSFLHSCGATYVTGPTGTNVNDLIIGVVG